MADVLVGPPHKVFLLNFGNIFKARPAFVAAAPNDKVKFVNRAGHDATLNFTGGIFGATTSVTLGDGQSETLTVSSVNDGRYAYTGTVVTANDLQGESSPEIIVDR